MVQLQYTDRGGNQAGSVCQEGSGGKLEPLGLRCFSLHVSVLPVLLTLLTLHAHCALWQSDNLD